MKSPLYSLVISALLPVMVQTASAAVLLTDNFNTTSGNSQNVNEDIVARQTGPLASVASGFFSTYTFLRQHHQVGNSTTDVGQPGGATNSGYVLLAGNGAFQSDLDIPNISTGPLTIEVDMYNTGSNPGGSTDPTEWVAFSLRSSGNTGPAAGAGEFGLLKRANGGVQVFQNGGEITGGAYDHSGAAVDGHWMATFSDTTGTGSAFNGNGSQVTLTNASGLVIGPITLSQLSSSGLRLGFTQDANQYAGIDNLTISGTAPTPALPPILFHDSFSVDAGNAGANADANQNLNFDLGNRQSGPVAPSTYTWIGTQCQDGNSGTGVGQPGGANNSAYVLLAFNGNFQSDMNIAAVASGPLTIEFDIYHTGSSSEWEGFSLRAPGTAFPVAAAGEFGFLKRQNGGIQVFQDGQISDEGTWDASGFATDPHMKLIFTDASGTGSAFTGNGSVVTMINGTTTLGTFTLGQLPSSGLELGFNASANELGGIDHLTISGTEPSAITLVSDINPPWSEVAAGAPWKLSVAAYGTPLSYQWFDQNGPISGATNASYAFNAVAGTNNYQVVITNFAGSVTSSIAQVVSSTNIVTVQNFSFEDGTGTTPSSWTAFNYSWCSVVDENGGNYPVYDPLAAPAQGNNFFACNTGPSQPTSGIYQEVGALLPNTTYTLTVAIGYSQANPVSGQSSWSPGTISLLNGTNNNGLVLATTNGLPTTPGTWQDFSATFSTGPSVSGDLTVELSVPGAATYQAQFDNVRLTQVGAPPVIPPTLLTDVSPLRSVVTTGAPWIFSVIANGYPLSYQWFNQNGPISGATTNSYSFNAVAGTNYYQVVITNFAGSVTSSIAQVISSTNIVTVKNFSFEDGTIAGPGGGTLPVRWTQGGSINWCSVVVDGGYPTIPDGTNLFAINEGPNDSTGGIYQDVGALLPNTTYTLTVAIGHNSWQNSPGIIALLNGTDNTGILLASTNGIPDAASTWQDYTTTFTTGASVDGDLTVELSVAPASTWQANFDDVRLTMAAAPAIVPPALLVDLNPLRSEVTTGAAWTLSVTANGNPLSYQWFNQNGPISGATKSSYSFNAVAGTNSYYVSVTNSAGALFSSTGAVISAASMVTVNNFSFENGTTAGPGGGTLPVMWTPFNNSNWCAVSSGTFASIPDGTYFFALNEGPNDPTGGIYQDVGPLLPNTTYTLTVAIGNSPNAPVTGQSTWSPGIISLLSGSDDTGILLASTNGLPDTAGDWQDFSLTFTSGASVRGDLTVELSVAGAPTYQATFDDVRLTRAAVVPPILGNTVISGGNLILTGTGGTANAPYVLLTTTNLASPIIWTTNLTGTLDATGSFSNAIPVNTPPAASFFKLSVQ